ncbi:hypothetical protein F4553_007093 [Allocatelliglobosispora scoriae]|uniref:DUF4193 domain-containing protein n=1 Tax=Allocatelliglobosispora scoriae TaxID=643052 RepID=A0A841C2X2_9ACTN|nr:DUF4193 family protein [Allocatelliglobosispora scoriae]MBB5873659.1 hypothetical protein [Allocatelliglobosispora scoriae]
MAAVDYDAPRTAPTEPETESLDLLQERRERKTDDLADTDFADDYILPGFDVLDEELSTTVVPVQPDEFRCGGCFLVLHRGLHAGVHRGQDICRDCA